MQRAKRQSSEILRRHLPLVRRIVAITSKRRRLSVAERDELFRFVASELKASGTHGLGPFRGYSSLESYLAVVVQRLCDSLMGDGVKSPQEPSPIEDAIRRTTSSLSPRETLILKMWFESGMTTQRIAAVLGLHSSEVHAVIAERTDGVQESLVRSYATPSSAND